MVIVADPDQAIYGFRAADIAVTCHHDAPKTNAGAATPPSSKAAALAWAVGSA